MSTAITVARAYMLVDSPNITIPTIELDTMPTVIKEMLPTAFAPTLAYGLDKILASSTILLDRKDALESNLNNAITDLMRRHFATDIAMTPGFRFDSTVVKDEHIFEGKRYDYFSENEALLSGDILIADVYRFFPAPYYLAMGNITGENFKAIIEENLNAVYSEDAFEHAGGWFDGFSGLNMDINITQDHSNRLLSLRRSDDNSSIEDTDILSVVGCARPFDSEATTTLCSYNQFTSVSDILNEGENYGISDFFITELLNGELATIFNRKNIKDISGITSVFEQPIIGEENLTNSPTKPSQDGFLAILMFLL
jgi:hypothetical protein